MVVACLASYSFARYRRKRREILFFSYIILMLMPFQVTLVPNYMIADALGILDTIWAIILPGVFSTFAIFLLTKYMRQIPSGYIEAATLDGATEWQIFTNIALPLCKNAIFALTFSSANTFNVPLTVISILIPPQKRLSFRFIHNKVSAS